MIAWKTVACPRCDAPAGSPCTSATGVSRPSQPHAERLANIQNRSRA